VTGRLLDAILEQCRRTPDAPAIGSASVAWTYDMLGKRITERTEQFAHRMRPGAVTAIVMAAEPESIAHVLATARAGRIPLLVPSGLPPWEEQIALEESGAAYLSARGMFLPLGEEPPPGQSFPSGLMQLTSGSLGPSRPALRTWEGVGEEIESVVSAVGLGPSDVVLVTSTPAHSYAFMAGVLAPLSVGAQVVLAPAASADPQACRPTIILGLPAAYAAWATGYPPDALDSVRFAFSAGAPLPDGLYATVKSKFGVPIRQDYGTTETGTISLDCAAVPDPLSVGTVLPHLDLRLEAEDDDGEIQVRGRAVARGYVSDGRLLPATDDDGWYHTLDTGTLDPDGRLRLRGRARSLLRSGTQLIDPRVLEAAALRIPGVEEAVALQVEAPGGDAIKVVVTGTVRQEDLDRWRREQWGDLAPSILIEHRQTLPRSPAGKLLRKYLL
jgi:long-chain acyl-CoA synthetase